MIPMLPEVGEAFRTVYNDHKKTGFNKTVISARPAVKKEKAYYNEQFM